MRVGIACFGHGLGATGGVQVYMRGLLQSLARHDTSSNEYVLLVGPDEPAPLEAGAPRFSLARVADRGVGAGSPWRRTQHALFGSSPEIERLALDVVHYPATRVLHRLRRTRTVLTFFDMQEELRPKFFHPRERWARRLLHRWSVHQAAVVIAPSQFTAETLEHHYGTPATKIVHVPPGVSERFFAPPAPDEADWLRSLGLRPGRFVLYPANPWPHKNHERLLRAWQGLISVGGAATYPSDPPRRAGLPARRPDGAEPSTDDTPTLVCTGRIAGEPRSVASMARSAGLPAERVLDLGFVSEEHLAALLRAARFMLFPSLFEGFGLPVLEALAAGCPVACADLPPLVEVAGDAAHYFDPTSDSAIADAASLLWRDVGRREDLRLRGRIHARRYRWDTLVPGLIAAYALAAKGR